MLSLLNLKANIFRDRGKFEVAEKCYQQLFEVASSTENSRALARYYLNRGILFKRQSRMEEAIDYFQKSIPHYEKEQDWKRIGRTSIGLGNIYADLSNNDLAKEHLASAIEMAEKTGSKKI